MEILQRIARGLSVLLCRKSSSSLPHHSYVSFSGIPGKSEVTADYQTQHRLFALLLPPYGKSYMMRPERMASQKAYL